MRSLAYAAVALSFGISVHAATPEAQLPKKHLAMFKTYCFECHDSLMEEGDVNLEELTFNIGKDIKTAESWQKILNAINSGEMPPEDEKQIDKESKTAFLDDLSNQLVTARKILSDTGGEITMRRLNRREYRNTIKELTGAEVDINLLPADGGGGTFDTVGSSQFMSSNQFEQYLKLGRGAIDEMFERQATQHRPSKVFRVEPEKTVNVQSAKAMKQLEENYKRFMQWKAGVDKAAAAPENKEIVAQILKENPNLDLSAFPGAAGFLFYRHAQKLKGAPDPKKYGFRDDDAATFSFQGGYSRKYAYLKHYAQLPHNDRGTYLKLAWGIQRIDVTPPKKDLPPGKYRLRVRAGAVKGSPLERRFIEIGHPQRVNGVPAGLTGPLISSHQVTGTIENPEVIETTVVISGDTPREFSIQERQPRNKKSILNAYNKHKRENGYGTPPAIWVDWVELEGPISEVEATSSRTYRVEPEKTVNVKNVEIIKRLEDTYKKKWLPWKGGVDKAVEAAENREIVAALRKKHPDYDSNPTLKYTKADLLKGAPDPRDYGGSDPINAVAALYSPYRRYHSYMKHYAELPHNDRGAYLKLSRGIQRFDVRPDPKDIPAGTYKLRIRVGAVKGSDPSRHFIEIGHPQKLNGTSPGFAKLLSTQPISGTIENPEIIEVDVEIGANTPRAVGIQERQPKSAKLLRQEFDRHKQKNGYGTPPAVWVDWMELEGPISETKAAKPTVTRVEPEKTINPENDEQVAKIEEGYARFTNWKKAVDKAAATPENQKKIAEIRKTDRLIDHPNRFYTFADRLEGTPHPKKFGIAGDVKKAAGWDPEADRKDLAYHKHYAALPHRDRGTYLKLAHGTGRIIISPKKKKLPVGNYIMRVRVGAVKNTPAARRFIQVGHPQRQIESRNWGLAGRALSTHQVTGTIENPQTIEIPLEVGADTPREFAVQEKQPNNGNLKALWDAHNKWKKENGYGHPPAIWIDWVELEGPLPKAELATSGTYRVEAEKAINSRNEKSIKQMEESFARFKRWQKGVDAVAKTPENQAIIAEIAKTEKHILHPLRFYRFAHRLKGTPDARDFGFPEAHAPQSANPDWPNLHAYLKHYASLPHRDKGAYLKPTKGTGRVIVSPEKLPIGKYTLRVRVGAVKGSDPSRHFIDVGHPQRTYTALEYDHGLEGRAISTHHVTGTIEKPQVIEVPLEVGPNTAREFAVQEKQPNNGKIQALWTTFNAAKKKNGYGIPPAIWIDWVELKGPRSPSSNKVVKQRREVETHANKKVGGTYDGWFKGGHEQAQALLKTGKPQKDIVDEAEAKSRIKFYERSGPSYRRYLEDPLTKTGSFLTVYQVNPQEMIALPPEHPSGWLKSKHVVDSLPAGEYKLRFRIGAVEGTSSDRHYVDIGAVPSEKQFNQIGSYQVTGTTAKPQIIEVPVTLTKGGPRKFALREKGDPKTAEATYLAAVKKSGIGPKPALWIDWVEWEGPFGAPEDTSGFSDWWISEGAGLDEKSRAKKVLEQFSRRAMRGIEPGADFIDRLVNIFEARRKAGEKFDIAIRSPLSIILASPGFIYLNEPGVEKERRKLNDRELAVRLAYFLWSAPPDQVLLDLAEQKNLSKPEVLRAQVDRMIADARSDEFVSGFMHQWLDMERLDFFQFDVNRHRDFDESTRAATRKEVYQSFAHLFRGEEQGQLGRLLKSDYVMINSLLATYYEIEGVSGDEFRKVKLPDDSVRGGLLGMAAIHAMGSDGVESSPVERGAWVLRHLLHNPPPPAPPNVPQLSRLADRPLNTRERLAAHMEEPQCASCHRKIDPIGFGMENFNAAGKWRTTESFHVKDKKARRALKGKKTTWKIDPSGKFYKGPEFGNFLEMRDLVAKQEDKFARGFTEHLIEYALGRPFGFTDEDLASGIVSSAKSKNYTISEFFQALVATEEFQSK